MYFFTKLQYWKIKITVVNQIFLPVKKEKPLHNKNETIHKTFNIIFVVVWSIVMDTTR